MESLNGLGILYFSSCYLAILNVWMAKVGYDARYAPDDNLFHRGFELVHILVLGTIIQHVRPVEEMSNTRGDSTTAVFAFSLTAEAFLGVYRYYDVFQNGIGGPESKRQALFDMRQRGLSSLLFLSAAIWATLDFQGEEATPNVNHGPILLCMVSFFAQNVHLNLERFVLIGPGRSHKELFVPLNLEFTCHRLGEWIMLMLGESVLALLIVEESNNHVRYYSTFYAGIITVTLFQYLYFRSQPDVDDHAMRRSSEGGMIFMYSMAVYSASLILVGCSFKIILHYFLHEDELADDLAGLKHLEEEKQRIANLYSWSLAMSFFSLDFMNFSHRGFTANFSRLLNSDGSPAWVPIFVMIVDNALIVMCACLSQLPIELSQIVLFGLVLAVVQTLLRTRGLRYFPVSKAAMARWPNCTQTQIAESS